jgi:hypothetical protein
MKIEWRASVLCIAHTAHTRPATIFIHNGAPQALVGCQAGISSDSWEMRRPAAASIASGDKGVERRGLRWRSFSRSLAAMPIWERAFRNHSESFDRASGGFKRPSIAFRKFQSFSWNRGLSMAYGRTAAKKIADRAVGRTGAARRRGERSLRAKAFGARQPGRLHIPPSSIPILLCRRLIDFEAGLRRRRDAPRGERIVNDADPFVKKKSPFLPSGGLGDFRIFRALMPRGARRRRWGRLEVSCANSGTAWLPGSYARPPRLKEPRSAASP